MAMVDDRDNEITHTKTNPVNLEWRSTIWVKEEEEDSEPLLLNLLHKSENEIGGDAFPDMEDEEEEVEGMEQLPGMLEDGSEVRIMPINNNAAPRNPPSNTLKPEYYDFEIQNTEESDHAEGDFSNIALMEVKGANHPNAQAQQEDRLDNANVEW